MEIPLQYIKMFSPECTGTKVQKARCAFPGFSKPEKTHLGWKSCEESEVNAF